MTEKAKPKLGLSSHFDVAAVFCLAVLPDLVRSFMATNSAGATTSSLDSLLWLLIVRSLQVSLPILVILKLRSVKWSDYGFLGFRPVWDTLVALGLVLAGYVAYYLLALSLLLIGFDFSADANALPGMMQEAQISVFSVLLVFAASCANGFAEELAIRSYLITRLGELTGSTMLAVVTTTILFAAYHSYQGRYGIVSALAVGSVFAIYFVTAKRFWPIAMAHAMMDFIPLVLMLNQDAG